MIIEMGGEGWTLSSENMEDTDFLAVGDTWVMTACGGEVSL